MSITPRLYSLTMCRLFWLAVWQPYVGPRLHFSFFATLPECCLPNWPVLRLLGPLWVQRLIADAVTARLAWLYRYHVENDLCLGVPTERMCQKATSQRLARGVIRKLSLPTLHVQIVTQIDWLVQLVIVAPHQRPPAEKLILLVCLCSRLAQYYAELCRRFGYREARALLADDLVHALGAAPGVLEVVQRAPHPKVKRPDAHP